MVSTSASLNTLRNISVLEAKLPFDIFTNLKSSIEDIPNFTEKYNNQLIGHMQEEYSLNHIKDSMSDFLLATANTWVEHNPGYVESLINVSKSNTDTYKLVVSNLWVNKQKKYEFNPIHTHTGVLSFVIWMNIPYDLEKEESYFPITSNETEIDRSNSHTSKFTFIYNDALGKIQYFSLPVDKSWEGTIIMFPASLNHCVYPFYTSDDYRISVSGNIQVYENYD